MAYKFQLGAATLSGSVTAEGDLASVAFSGSSHVSASSIALLNASGLADAGLADVSGKLTVDIGGLGALGGATISQADEFMFDDAGTLKKVTFSNLEDSIFGNVSGDATVAAGGALTIGANAVEGSMLNSNVAGDGLTYAGNNIDVLAAQTTITSVKNDALVVGRATGNDHIDFATAGNIKLQSNNVTRLSIQDSMVSSSVALAIGGNIQMAGDEIDVPAAGAMGLFASMGANNLTLGGSTSTVLIPGNLTVSGTTVEIDAAFVVTSSIQFEGVTPDGNEITLTSADPSGDRTITLPDVSGHVPLLAGAVSNANVTAAEFALLDGGSTLSTGITVHDTQDGFLFNDNGTMKHLRADQLKTYIGTPSLNVTGALSNGETLAVGMNFFNNLGGAISVNCPASAGLAPGDIIRIKAGPDCSSVRTLTINRAGSQTFDAVETALILESPNAAISLIYVDTDDFRIM